MPLLLLLFLLALVILIILSATKKIRWWWPVGFAVAGLIFIAIASGEEELAAMMFGFAGLIIAIATAVVIMSALKSPLSNFLEETVGEGFARVGVIFAYLIVYFAGLKAGASIFQEASSVSQEIHILAFSAVLRAPADAIETILETTKAPWLIFLGVLMVGGYVIYQRIRGGHQADNTNVEIESERLEEGASE